MNKTLDPTNCGLRLKKARLMAGYTRQTLEDKYGISLNTLQAWEQGKAPLTLKGAEKIVKALKKSGVHCTTDWLLNGKSEPPKLIDMEQIQTLENNDIKLLNSDFIQWNDGTAILREIESFRAFNPNSSVIIVMDDGMLPFYSIGDYVGGKRKLGNKIDEYIGTHCIIETKDGLTMVRKLGAGKFNNTYTLSCIHPMTTISSPTLYDVELASVAPVIWHRKKDI